MPYLELKTQTGYQRIDLDEVLAANGKPASPALRIGRHPDNLLVLQDDRASREHAVIERAPDGRCRVRDLDSRNGTLLNNEKISEATLGNGDVIRIGGTELRYIDPDQAELPVVGETVIDGPQRPVTPDYHAAAEQERERAARQATLDLDLNAAVTQVSTDYEKRLHDIIDAAIEKPFEESDISFVDSQGVTVHQASGAGLESGSRGKGKRRDEESTGGEGLRAFRMVMFAAMRARATDVHLEPRLENAAIRLRVDGYMLSAVELSMTVFKRMLGVVKILCQIDTTQRNAVQDGHFSAMIAPRVSDDTVADAQRIDFRVSLTPSMYGQKMVIRILDSSNAPSRLHELGLVPWMYEKLRTIATRDAGFLLACGPTGSGKTTTLYSCLREIDVETRNAITIEDPVEYHLEGATQIPIDHDSDNTFAHILRSCLRQDPDVIFVGEIRDLETATVAMQASMTGHLVYSTVHSKDSIGAVFRLLDLGVEPYLVANALNVILAQRLVRTICPTCRKPVQPTPAQNMKMGRHIEGVKQVYVPVGCRQCLRTGFIGRRALFELLEFNDEMRDVVLKTPSIQGIRAVARNGLFMSLKEFGYQLVANGICSMDEIDRVAGSE